MNNLIFERVGIGGVGFPARVLAPYNNNNFTFWLISLEKIG